MTADPRVTPGRVDLASRALEGLAQAGAYVDPVRMTVVIPAAAIRKAPEPGAEQVDQILFGEKFDVLEIRGAYAWGQAARDGYVGFVEVVALGPAGAAATHRISAIRTYAFAEPSIKSLALGPYSINALIVEEATEGRFIKAANTGWIVREHLAPIGVFETDPVAVAERFLGAPYLWGGRESLGVDCSGLVQQAQLACGRACPRDTDQQQLIGEAVQSEALARGDLVFWKGHVGIMLDAERLLHANAFHMATAIEPLAETRARYMTVGVGEPTAYRRP